MKISLTKSKTRTDLSLRIRMHAGADDADLLADAREPVDLEADQSERLAVAQRDRDVALEPVGEVAA